MLSTRSASPGTRMDRVEDALAALREGRTVIVVDDESRENEGDLILPAQSATTEQLAFAIRHSTGIICAPMAGQELDRMGHLLNGLEPIGADADSPPGETRADDDTWHTSDENEGEER